MNGLLRSRKFYLACFGVVQALVFQYLSVPDEVWLSISALIAVLIHSIAVEDAASKSAAPQLTGELRPAAQKEAEIQAGLGTQTAHKINVGRKPAAIELHPMGGQADDVK